MATQYTHKKVEGDFEIYRNSEHVATYDPVTEDVTYTNGNDKYAGPVGKEVAEITKALETQDPAPAEENSATPTTEGASDPAPTDQVTDETNVTPIPDGSTVPLERTPLDGETELTNRIAGICYDNYCARVGGKAFNGDPLPAWEEFSNDPEKQLQANAWRGVGIDAEEIVCDQLDKERPSGPISDAVKENGKLKQYVASLEGEVRDLRNQRDGVEVDRTPDRYKGIPSVHKDAPVQDPTQGDLTPEFVAWARDGGYTKEQFLQVYSGRLKDLTYPTPKEEEGE